MTTLHTLKTIAKDFIESRQWPKRPEKLNFEISAACDARCIHCPRLDMDRPMKAMSMKLFQRLIDEANELRVPELCPNGFGEICTIPVDALQEYFSYIAFKKRRFKILINTNGNRMNEERSDIFIKHSVKLINVTIDGATAETAESIRKNLSFNRIEANIKRLLAMRDAAGKKYPKVRVGVIAMPQTIPEFDLFFQAMAQRRGLCWHRRILESVEQRRTCSPPIPGAPEQCPIPNWFPNLGMRSSISRSQYLG